MGGVYSIDDATTADSITELQETMMKMDLNDQQHDGGIVFDAVQWSSSGLSQDHTWDTYRMGSGEAATDSTHASRNNAFVLQCNLMTVSYKLFPVLRSVSFDPFDLSPLFNKLANSNSWKASIQFVSIYIDAMTIRDFTVLVRERNYLLLSLSVMYEIDVIVI